MLKAKVLLPLLAAAAVSACEKPQTVQMPDISAVDLKIAQAVEKAANANAAIAEVEVAAARPTLPAPGASVPPGVILPAHAVQPVTLEWNGPAETLLSDIADRIGYAFEVSGHRPVNPAMVVVVAENEPVNDVVYRVGNMIDGFGDVVLNFTAKKIELRYGG